MPVGHEEGQNAPLQWSLCSHYGKNLPAHGTECSRILRILGFSLG